MDATEVNHALQTAAVNTGRLAWYMSLLLYIHQQHRHYHQQQQQQQQHQQQQVSKHNL